MNTPRRPWSAVAVAALALGGVAGAAAAVNRSADVPAPAHEGVAVARPLAAPLTVTVAEPTASRPATASSTPTAPSTTAPISTAPSDPAPTPTMPVVVPIEPVAAAPGPGMSSSGASRAVGARCPGYESLLASRGLPVEYFSRIMYRESKCRASARSRTRDSGLLQINDANHAWLSDRFGAHVTASWLMVPENNVRAAAALYRTFGTTPWATR